MLTEKGFCAEKVVQQTMSFTVLQARNGIVEFNVPLDTL